MRNVGFPWSPQLVSRKPAQRGGVILQTGSRCAGDSAPGLWVWDTGSLCPSLSLPPFRHVVCAQVARTFASAGGTIQATRLLFEEGRLMAANVAGGTHHAFRARQGCCSCPSLPRLASPSPSPEPDHFDHSYRSCLPLQ